MTGARYRPSRVEVSPAAIAWNVAQLVELSRPATVCAVVKADGYGHGALVAARAALGAGATMLGVATVEEAVALRDGGVDAPLLVLSEPPRGSWSAVAGIDADAMVYTAEGIGEASEAGRRRSTPLRLHLKLDTGMHRVGCPPEHAVEVAGRLVGSSGVELAGLATHFASADDHDSMFPAVQLERFVAADRELRAAGIDGYVRHTANSAAALSIAASRFEMVRCGIACYGIAPSESLTDRMEYRPAARLVSAVSHVRRLEAGEPVSYGCRYVTEELTTIATVPIGYADGVSRSFGLDGGVVLVRGRRRPVVGVVTMDQLMVDVGLDGASVGDEVVLIGDQGDDRLSANEVAARGATIGYELVARLGSRLPREVVDR